MPSAWRRLAAAGDLGERRAMFALADLDAIPIARVPHRPLVRRCWELRGHLTIYDAAAWRNRLPPVASLIAPPMILGYG